MFSKINIFQKDIFNNFNNENNEYLLYYNYDIESYDNYELNNINKKESKIDDYAYKYEIDSPLSQMNISKELFINSFQPKYKNSTFLNNEIQKSTKQTTNYNENANLSNSQKDNIQEINLNQKRKEPDNNQPNNKLNDKGHKRGIILNRIKTNLFINIQRDLVDKLMKKSAFCKRENKKLNKIEPSVYIISKASENLDLLNLKLKDVYSLNNVYNEKVINSIFEVNDFPPLVDALNKTIKELLNIYTGQLTIEDINYKDFIDSYQELINNLRTKKVPEYVEDFEKYFKNIENEYNNINIHPRPKRGKKK